jgi:hypothetical protein
MVYDGSKCVVNDDGSEISRYSSNNSTKDQDNKSQDPGNNEPNNPNNGVCWACSAEYPCLSSWEPPSWWNLNPKYPDYYSLTISKGVIAGFTGNITLDRYGNIYVGGGVNIGKSISPWTGSLNGGWIGSMVNHTLPDQANITSFLTGLAINSQAGIVGNYAINWSPSANKYISHISKEEGGVLPLSFGISAIFSFQLFDPVKAGWR